LKLKANHILDFRDTITPLALLKMNQVLREMQIDEVLEIITRDPDTQTDVLKVLPGSSCQLIGMEFSKEADCCRIRLRKTRQLT
jgi:TusA-related sulfurtransferase